MSLPSQPLSSEEPEQQLAHSSGEEGTPTEIVANSASFSEDSEEQPAPIASEEIPTQPEASSALNEHITSTPDEDITFVPTEDTISPSSETTTSPSTEDTIFTPSEAITPTPDEAIVTPTLEEEEDDDDEDDDDDDEEQKGIFIQRGWLIAAGVVVVAALVATLLLLVSRPQDPPTDWIASYIPPAGSSSATRILYYLHWNNQNSDLKGQLQLAANSNGTPQSLTVPVVGLYNKENRIIYVVITVNGQPDTLTGTINQKNDTLTLNQVGSTSQDSQLIFHTGSLSDYQQATKKLGPAKK